MKQKTKIKVMFIHRRSAMKKKSIYVNQIGSHIRDIDGGVAIKIYYDTNNIGNNYLRP